MIIHSLRRFAVLVFILFACAAGTYAQRFAKELASFKSQDSIAMPAPNGIVFTGSSSFTKWTDVQNYFPAKRIINRAFGGSTLEELVANAEDVIIKYQPKQVVIYCGENDIADGATPAVVYNRFVKLYDIIHAKLPKAQVVFVSIKPSPSRRAFWGNVTAANGMIRDFLSEKVNTYFIDVYYPMLAKGSETHGSYFISDSLHMNATGYKLWQKLMEPYLLKTK